MHINDLNVGDKFVLKQLANGDSMQVSQLTTHLVDQTYILINNEVHCFYAKPCFSTAHIQHRYFDRNCTYRGLICFAIDSGLIIEKPGGQVWQPLPEVK